MTKDEESALQWAIDFFRKRAAEMTRDGSERASIELAVNTLLDGWIYDAERDSAEEMDARTAKFINDMRNHDAAHLVARLAAMLMERGDQLPKSMRDFVIDFLRDPKWETGKRGPKTRTLVIREHRRRRWSGRTRLRICADPQSGGQASMRRINCPARPRRVNQC